MLYQKSLKPVLFKLDPESVHNFFISAGEMMGKWRLSQKAASVIYGYNGRDISKTVDGLRYQTPFLLSAGFDCNGALPDILPYISFGGEEVGSITAKFCTGNPRPRFKRLPRSQSLLINKGLSNRGVEQVIERLKSKKKREGFVVGVSIARTNSAESSSAEAGIEDYLYSFRRLNEEGVGDYYTLNISCPNAFCGETFAEPSLLKRLLDKLSEVKCERPVYVKMPINLPWESFDGILKILDASPMIKGVVIGNLNKDYSSLDVRSEAPEKYSGGLSGKPCFEPSNELIRKTRAAYGNRFTIIGTGGVMSVEAMRAKFEAGSDLVALITGMIYNGPGFIKELSEAYSKMF